MAETTGIEWCDATFNSHWGCAEVSPGCSRCYARTWATRMGFADTWPEKGAAGASRDHGFRFFGDKHWDAPLKWARTMPAKLGRRPRVFTASMADVFEEHPALEEVRGRLLALIARTPELDWLLLTKRPEKMRDWLAAWADGMWGRAAFPPDALSGWLTTEHRPRIMQWPLPNLWLGVSIENARFTWRADVLREIPAAVRFISAEPLLGSLLAPFPVETLDSAGRRRLGGYRKPLDLTGIDWVIAGGESGPGARPMRLEWVRELRDACKLIVRCPTGVECTGCAYCEVAREAADASPRVAFHFKQWGEYAPVVGHLSFEDRNRYRVLTAQGLEPFVGIRHGSYTRWGEPALTARGEPIYLKAGKKAAGAVLDGAEWREFPRSRLTAGDG